MIVNHTPGAARAIGALVLVLALSMALAAPAASADGASTATPHSLQAAEVNQRDVLLEWEHGTDGVPPTEVIILNVTTGQTVWYGAAPITSRRMTNLEPETTYVFRVHAYSRDGGLSEPTDDLEVTTAALEEATPPVNLTATPYHDVVLLTWDPTMNDPDVRYRVRNVTVDSAGLSSNTEVRWTSSLEPGGTYTFEVTSVTPEGEESDPSDRVTVTLPVLEPIQDLEADLVGHTVNLTWSRPASVEPGRVVRYMVHLDGVLETQTTLMADVVEISIPRVNPGTTHVYEVSARVHVAGGRLQDVPPGPAATVEVPAEDDTTPPTTPEALLTYEDCVSFNLVVVITEESVDDTTPQSEIRYEGLLSNFSWNQLWVAVHDMGLEHPANVPGGFLTHVRAVDEAGNRSGIAEIVNDPRC